MVPEFRRPQLREIVFRSYRIIYRVNRVDKSLEIVRFWHGARGFPQFQEADKKDSESSRDRRNAAKMQAIRPLPDRYKKRLGTARRLQDRCRGISAGCKLR